MYLIQVYIFLFHRLSINNVKVGINTLKMRLLEFISKNLDRVKQLIKKFISS